MAEFNGWLLDLFEDPRSGIILWFIGGDSRRIRLRQRFSITFYAAGSRKELQDVETFLRDQSIPFINDYTQRKDLYKAAMINVLAIQTQPARLSALVRRVSKHFPNMDLYNADLPIFIRHAAQHDTFPLAYCRVEHEGSLLQDIEVLDSPWDLDPQDVPLRTFLMALDSDPRYEKPQMLTVRFGNEEHLIPLRHELSSLIRLNSLLKRSDPDLVLTNSGDTWLIPELLKMAKQARVPLQFNREEQREVYIKKEGSYFSYGRIVYRGQQALFFGRCHIDSRNAMLWQDYELASALEMARASRLPIQTAARCSPGTGINMMETYTAMRQNILVPWQKTHGEEVKTAYELLHNDQGGLVYQPTGGVHVNVGMIDFVSLYPSIMTHCNISPELPIPKQLGDSPYPPGLIPITLKPLLEKRIALKQRMLNLESYDPAHSLAKARSSTLKMLLVCCFGYMGYKAAKFGRIESHEAISALGREALLRAKEAAEDMGFTVLHLYVDGIWVKKEGCTKTDDFLPLLNRIFDRTALPISLDCIYRWVAFLPARNNANLTVPNRYFGIKQDVSSTVRGIELRTHDTAPYVARMQEGLIKILKQAATLQELQQSLPEALRFLLRSYKGLRQGKVPVEDLVVHKRMGRELDAYKVASPAAMAARQLEQLGKPARLGQRMPLVYTLGKPNVQAWHARVYIDPRSVNYTYYRRLLIRAASSILQPFGMTEQILEDYLRANGAVQTSLRWMDSIMTDLLVAAR